MIASLLAASVGLAPAPVAVRTFDEAEEAVQEILDEFDDAMQAFGEAYTAAEGDPAAQQKLFETTYPDANDYAPRLMEVAETYPSSAAAVTALVWVAGRSSGEEKTFAIEWLVADHFESERMAEIVFSLPSDDKGRETLNRLLEESPHAKVQGAACYALAQQFGPPYDESEEWTTRDEYFALMRRAMADYPDVPVRGRRLADLAGGAIFELERLQIGMDVPDIVGEDVDGVPFKLSDYRGKVVVLDFWGDW